MQVANNPQTNAKGPEMGSACRRRHRGRAAWRPGWNTHGYIGRGSRDRRVGKQAQVLIVNGYKRLRALSKPEQRTLQDMFPPMRSAYQSTIAGRILSGLLRIPVRTIENVVAHVLKQVPDKQYLLSGTAGGIVLCFRARQ